MAFNSTIDCFYIIYSLKTTLKISFSKLYFSFCNFLYSLSFDSSSCSGHTENRWDPDQQFLFFWAVNTFKLQQRQVYCVFTQALMLVIAITIQPICSNLLENLRSIAGPWREPLKPDELVGLPGDSQGHLVIKLLRCK